MILERLYKCHELLQIPPNICRENLPSIQSLLRKSSASSPASSPASRYDVQSKPDTLAGLKSPTKDLTVVTLKKTGKLLDVIIVSKDCWMMVCMARCAAVKIAQQSHRLSIMPSKVQLHTTQPYATACMKLYLEIGDKKAVGGIDRTINTP